MDLHTFYQRLPKLTDLELAVLLSLIAQQHCLITSAEELTDDLAIELSLIVSEVFDLSYVVVSPDEQNSVEAFRLAILDHQHQRLHDGVVEGDHHNQDLGQIQNGVQSQSQNRQRYQHHPRSVLSSISGYGNTSTTHTSSHTGINRLDQSDLNLNPNQTPTQKPVVNVIIAKDFNLAPRDVQIAALELIDKRRIFGRTSVHPVPKNFLFIPLMVKEKVIVDDDGDDDDGQSLGVERHANAKLTAETSYAPRLNPHLNDRIFMSHHHNIEDGFANLEELEIPSTSDLHSTQSTTTVESEDGSEDNNNNKTSDENDSHLLNRKISLSVVDKLREMGHHTEITTEVRRYIQDLVVFLRMERGVESGSKDGSGISPSATTSFISLSKYLAPLHDITYVTPSLVALAARKIYPHRILISQPSRDRSIQWGSDLNGVREVLNELTPEAIIENVLRKVVCPI